MAGTVLTGAGVLTLLFVAYQLWGTGIYNARAQSDLKAAFKSEVAERASPAPAAATAPSPPVSVPEPPPPPAGEAVAIIRIPKIGLDQAVVQGVSTADLRKGPGHYPWTPLPGQGGNAAIAGHRTTYGAPFNRLDELSPGDEIHVTTLKGSSTYRVRDLAIVQPSQVDVLDPTPEPRLTLTTCNPKYSAAERLVVVADLAPGEAGTPPTPPPSAAGGTQPAPRELAQAGLSASRHSKLSTGAWGLATVLVGGTWWSAVRRRRRRSTYVAGAPLFLIVLFGFYANLELLLPSNF